MEFLRRRRADAQSECHQPTLEDASFCEAFPALTAYITRDDYDDGTKRLTASLTVFCEEGTIKAVLNDRDSGESLWASGPGMWSVFGALERHLALGTGEWRRQKRADGGKGRRGR